MMGSLNKTYMPYDHMVSAILAIILVIAAVAPRFLAYAPGLAGLVLAVSYPLMTGNRFRLNKAIFTWVAIFCGLGLLSSLWALDREFAVERSLKMAALLVPASLFVSILQSSIFKLKYIWLLVASALGAALICFDTVFDFPVYRFLHGYDELEKVRGSDLNRSVVALVVLSFPVFGLLPKSKNIVLLAVLLASFAGMVFLTASMSAQFAFILGLIFWFAFPYSKDWAWLSAITGTTLLLFVTPMLTIWAFVNHAGTIEAISFLDSAFATQRMEIWSSVSRYALQSPLYGFGIEATRAVEAFDSEQIYRKSVTELHPHNFSVQLWIEFGLLGILIVAAFLGSVLYMTQKYFSYPQMRVALPTIITLLTVGSFGYGLWQSWWLGLIMTAAAFVFAVKEDVIAKEE